VISLTALGWTIALVVFVAVIVLWGVFLLALGKRSKEAEEEERRISSRDLGIKAFPHCFLCGEEEPLPLVSYRQGVAHPGCVEDFEMGEREEAGAAKRGSAT
jgi:hypothetical protein